MKESTRRLAHDALKAQLHELKSSKPANTVAWMKKNDVWSALPVEAQKILIKNYRNQQSKHRRKIAALVAAITEIKYVRPVHLDGPTHTIEHSVEIGLSNVSNKVFLTSPVGSFEEFHENFVKSINSDIALKHNELKIYEKYRIVGGSAVWKGAEVVYTANGDIIVAKSSPQGLPWVGCNINDCNDLRYEWIE